MVSWSRGLVWLEGSERLKAEQEIKLQNLRDVWSIMQKLVGYWKDFGLFSEWNIKPQENGSPPTSVWADDEEPVKEMRRSGQWSERQVKRIWWHRAKRRREWSTAVWYFSSKMVISTNVILVEWWALKPDWVQEGLDNGRWSIDSILFLRAPM